MSAIRNAGTFDRMFWRLGFLDRATELRVQPRILAGIILFHLLALLACIPWLFTWSGLAIMLAGPYLFGTLGINVGFHRLLTHRSFACPIWLERTLAVIGTWCWQSSPINWVAVHRMHHQHSDEPTDPHSPRGGFVWSHMGWFLVADPKIWNVATYDRYARDLLRVRFYKNLERPRVWRKYQFIQYGLFLAIGAIIGALVGGTAMEALRTALSWLVWGVFVRTVVVWHITWSVNSVTHIWGYRNFDTRDDSRNNLLVGLVSNGEGWHNNHHAQPRSAAHGMKWWELDVSYTTIRALEMVGLAWGVVRPRKPAAPRQPDKDLLAGDDPAPAETA